MISADHQDRYRNRQRHLGRVSKIVRVPVAARSQIQNMAKLLRDREDALVPVLVRFVASLEVPTGPIIKRRKRADRDDESKRQMHVRRQREKGFVFVQFWIPGDAAPAMHTLAEVLRAGDDTVISLAPRQLLAPAYIDCAGRPCFRDAR